MEMTQQEFAQYTRSTYGDWSTSPQALRVRRPVKLMTLFARCGLQLLTVPCSADTHVNWIFMTIREKLKFPFKCQRVTFAGKEIATGTIEDIGLQGPRHAGADEATPPQGEGAPR